MQKDSLLKAQRLQEISGVVIDWLTTQASSPFCFQMPGLMANQSIQDQKTAQGTHWEVWKKHYYKVWSFLFMCSLFWWVNFSYYMHLYTLKHFQDPPPWAAKTGWPLHFMDLWWMECHKLKFCGVTYGMLESWWRWGFSRCLLKRWVAGVITWWLWDVQRWAKRWWKDVATCNMTFVQPQLGGSQQMPTALRSWKFFVSMSTQEIPHAKPLPAGDSTTQVLGAAKVKNFVVVARHQGAQATPHESISGPQGRVIDWFSKV